MAAQGSDIRRSRRASTRDTKRVDYLQLAGLKGRGSVEIDSDSFADFSIITLSSPLVDRHIMSDLPTSESGEDCEETQAQLEKIMLESEGDAGDTLENILAREEDKQRDLEKQRVRLDLSLKILALRQKNTQDGENLKKPQPSKKLSKGKKKKSAPVHGLEQTNSIPPGAQGSALTCTTRSSVEDIIAAQSRLVASTDSGDSSSSDASVCSSQTARRKKRGLKSGIHATTKNSVRSRQKFPHAALQHEHLGGKVPPSFHTLNFPLFVAGELEIITRGDRSPEEVKTRLDLLKKQAYRANLVDVKVIRDVQEAILTKIENGLATWKSDFTDVESGVIDSARLVAARQQRPPRSDGRLDSDKSGAARNDWMKDKVFWCAKYNSGDCPHKKSHLDKLWGRDKVQVSHCCSTCFKLDGVQSPHPSIAADCPHADE